jgi:hypothetical protein
MESPQPQASSNGLAKIRDAGMRQRLRQDTVFSRHDVRIVGREQKGSSALRLRSAEEETA